MKIKVFVLEDNEERIKKFKFIFKKLGWDSVFSKNVEDSKKYLLSNEFDILFLDHDLDNEYFVDVLNKNTGSELCRWISENPLDYKPIYIIHSLNTVGQKYMENTLKERVYIIPYVWIPSIFFDKIKFRK
jgi:CheY-like chemotaxis protein